MGEQADACSSRRSASPIAEREGRASARPAAEHALVLVGHAALANA